MDTGISIRPLEDADFAAFLDIQQLALANSPEVFGSDYEWFNSISILSKEQRYERYLNFPYTFLLGAVTDDGRIVGMVGLSCDPVQTKTRHKCRTWGLFVASQYRGQGIAKRLLESIIETARDIVGCEQIQLSVSTQNEASYQLYLRNGFIVYGTEVHAMKIGTEYVDEYLMVKFLR